MRQATKSLYRQLPLGANPVVNFPKWASSTWRECEKRIAQIHSMNITHNNDLARVVGLVDEISFDVCLVADSASCAMATHGDERVRTVAEQTYLDLYQNIQKINVDPIIFNKLIETYKLIHSKNVENANSKTIKMENSELERVTRRLLMEFKWDGAGLPTPQLRHQMSELQKQLRASLARAMSVEQDVQTIRPPFKLEGMEIPKTHGNFLRLVHHYDDPKRVYEQFYQPDPLLNKLEETRAEIGTLRGNLAKLVGFESYAHFVANQNMVRQPKVAKAFLDELLEGLDPLIAPLLPNGKIQDWEVPILMNKLVHSNVPPRVNAVFTVQRCLNAIKKVAKLVFDVDIVECDMNTSESARWCDDSLCREWMIIDGESGKKGVLYLDLFNRPSKSAGAALYPIRTRRHPTAAGDDKNLSVALLSYNFANTKGMDSIIGHGGFCGLMHEFGHALHSILSETKYQHLSGTRGEMDFVETPSLLLERMAWHPQIVRLVDQGRVLSNEDYDTLGKKRTGGYAAMELYELALLAYYDLELSLDYSPENDNSARYWDVYHSKSRIYCPPELRRTTRKHLFFHHYLGAYAGCMYTYPWSSANVAEIWRTKFERDPLNPESGKQFKNELLSRGGSREPTDVLRSLIHTDKFSTQNLIQDLR